MQNKKAATLNNGPWTDDSVAANGRAVMDNFSDWFGRSVVTDDKGYPKILYHGTATDFTFFKGFSHWGSTTPKLANDYAEFRGYEGDPVFVMPVFMRIQRPFDADQLPEAVRVRAFFDEAMGQATGRGVQVDSERRDKLLVELIKCAMREESGPVYSRHDFWNNPSSLFGADGAKIIKQLFEMMRFDGIKLTEQGEVTYGALDPSQVKSAIGNSGLYLLKSAELTDGQAALQLERAMKAREMIEKKTLVFAP